MHSLKRINSRSHELPSSLITVESKETNGMSYKLSNKIWLHFTGNFVSYLYIERNISYYFMFKLGTRSYVRQPGKFCQSEMYHHWYVKKNTVFLFQ